MNEEILDNIENTDNMEGVGADPSQVEDNGYQDGIVNPEDTGQMGIGEGTGELSGTEQTESTDEGQNLQY